MIRTVAALLMFAGSAACAADPAPDPKALDLTIVASLREVHNLGADLYNNSHDFVGAFRMYEGALLAVKPVLANRPDVQKTIADGLTKANLEPNITQRAFILHETIEKVRADLKGPPKAIEPMPMPKAKEPIPKAKGKEPKPMPKGAVEIGVAGKVLVKGKPLEAGSVTFVSLDKTSPKVINAAVKDGAYSVKSLPAGKYAVAVTGAKAGAVPAKFATTDTSGLTYQAEAKNVPGQFDIDLK